MTSTGWPGCDWCGRSEEWHRQNHCKPRTRDKQVKTLGGKMSDSTSGVESED